MRRLRLAPRLAALAAAGLGLSACVAPPPPLVAYPAGPTYLGTYCSAGAYQCAIAQPGPAGTPCACPGIGAPSYGVIR